MRDDLMGPATDSRGAEAAPRVSASRETILLVEEEQAARTSIGALLRGEGYRVLEASSSTHAGEICALPTTEIDLLLTNVTLSDITGPGLAQRLVGERPQLRVVFLSNAGVGLPFNTEHPNVRLLRTPFPASALLETLREMLSRPRLTP
jgi:CheY-like chemotaxis protein